MRPSGPWLVFAAPAAAAAAYGWLVFAATFAHPGAIGPNYNADGTDWMVYHGAVQSYFDEKLATIFDGDRFTAFLNQRYGAYLSESLPFRPWVYPPSYLLLLLPFGWLGFAASFAAFQIVTAAALAAAVVVGAGEEDRAWRAIAVCALACPAASINAVDGQNAFLSAAILVAGLRLLDARPALAGMALGLLTVKPQFALLAPLALIACRAWRALLGAAASASLMVLASAILFGWSAWVTWLHLTAANLIWPDAKWIEYGRMWGNSVWTCATVLGAPAFVATLLQLAFSVGAAAAVCIAFRHRMTCRAPILLAATVLAAPHWSPYDAVLLTLAGAWWLALKPGAARQTWPWILMLALWLIPVLSPPLLTPAGRLAPLLIAGFIGAAMRLDLGSRKTLAFA
jgi:alpha-1,2-mannosyltransferase